MSKHHNTKHRRGRSNYPARLEARGETTRVNTNYRGADNQPVRMPFFDADGRKVSSAASIGKAH